MKTIRLFENCSNGPRKDRPSPEGKARQKTRRVVGMGRDPSFLGVPILAKHT